MSGSILDRSVSIPYDPGTNTYRYAKSWIIAEPGSNNDIMIFSCIIFLGLWFQAFSYFVSLSHIPSAFASFLRYWCFTMFFYVLGDEFLWVGEMFWRFLGIFCWRVVVLTHKIFYPAVDIPYVFNLFHFMLQLSLYGREFWQYIAWSLLVRLQ